MTVAAVLLGTIAWAFLALGSAPVMSARAELLIVALSTCSEAAAQLRPLGVDGGCSGGSSTHRAYRREGSPRDRRTDRVKDLVGERAIFDGPREDRPAH